MGMTRSGSTETPINFAVHVIRAGRDGAWADFEQMLALLVSAIHGRARQVLAQTRDFHPSRGPAAHSQVIAYFKDGRRPRFEQAIGHDLASLRKWRNRADYDLTYPTQHSLSADVLVAVDSAAHLLEQLARLR